MQCARHIVFLLIVHFFIYIDFFDFFFGFCTFCTSFNFTQSDVFVEVIAIERFSHIIKINRNLMDIVVVNVVVINSNPFVILNHPVVQEKKIEQIFVQI